MKKQLLGALMLLSVPLTAWAHLMPAQQGTLNVLGNAVFAAISLPFSAFTVGDDNRDGRLSQGELATHAAALQAEIKRRLHIYDGANTGRVDLVAPMAEPDERSERSTAGATHFIVLLKVSFDAPPEALRIETDLWGKQVSERQLTIKAINGSVKEAVILSPLRPVHRFFRSRWMVLRDYIVVGMEHILFGADHLLFLLTIIVAAAGWRYWLGVLTSFTVAHSVTLTLSLFGVVRAPSSLIEPLIAASIVLVAVLNLRQRVTKPRQRIAIVFACGLLHGLGFASSIAAMGLSDNYRLASVLGFNAGIEAGQAMFLVAVLAVVAAIQALARTRIGARCDNRLSVAYAASLVAAVVGAFWFVQRIGLTAA